VLIYGHRGAAGEAPENTLAAFRQALAAGADGVELDVRATADGIPVVLHDRGLERTTSGSGNVDEISLAEVRAADAGQGAKVPTLEEAMTLLAGRTRVDIELKQPGIEREILRILRNHREASWAISSFDWEALRAVRRLDRATPLWPVTRRADDGLFAVAKELKAPMVALQARALTADVAHRCVAAGLGVMAWTVNDLDAARRVRALGAAILCTDLPGVARRGLSSAGAATA